MRTPSGSKSHFRNLNPPPEAVNKEMAHFAFAALLLVGGTHRGHLCITPCTTCTTMLPSCNQPKNWRPLKATATRVAHTDGIVVLGRFIMGALSLPIHAGWQWWEHPCSRSVPGDVPALSPQPRHGAGTQRLPSQKFPSQKCTRMGAGQVPAPSPELCSTTRPP